MLSEAKIKALKPRDKPYKVSDFEGLYVLVKPSGSKLWYMKYRYLTKEKKLSIGSYPTITLAEAREVKLQARKQLLLGNDPQTVKQEKKRQKIQADGNSFEKVAKAWIEHAGSVWTDKTRLTKSRRLEMHIYPYIGNVAITNLTAPKLLEVLRQIEKKEAYDVARRMKQAMGSIFKYAVLEGYIDADPTPILEHSLKPVRRGRFAAIEAKELPKFLEDLERAQIFRQTRLAIDLMLLTFVRTSELIKAKWSEIDLEEAAWIIPSERMKMGKSHMVPLSNQSVEILRELYRMSGRHESWVFPGQGQAGRFKPISNNTILQVLRRMGYSGKMTGHGFRALAMSTIKEKLGWRHEVVDRQLAHEHHNTVTAAYDRAEFIDDRRKMMQDWADYISKLQKKRS